MKEKALYDELLKSVSGGKMPSEDQFDALCNAMELTDGKNADTAVKYFRKRSSFMGTNRK